MTIGTLTRLRLALALAPLLVTAGGCGPQPSTPGPDPAPAGTAEANGTGRDPASAPAGSSSLHCDQLPFVENVYWTTDYGPAAANVRSQPSNFLLCDGPAYALCYYSGPEPLPCVADEEKGVAHCECYGFRSSTETYEYSIDVNSILNTCAYVETVRDCGHDGSDCAGRTNAAPACQYMNQQPQTLWPGADLISTFSLAKESEYGQGCTPCFGVYAGCMTAPCYERRNDDGETVVICDCPLYEGRYQVGQDGVSCDAGEGLVWSASYDPNGCRSAGDGGGGTAGG
ncbi:MAG: hypothetical protein D6696_14385 [Acidobacteria bacterium]|nr:MAG: hypothetical protein D6696_14385 [Acidobacteriota bacterium]